MEPGLVEAVLGCSSPGGFGVLGEECSPAQLAKNRSLEGENPGYDGVEVNARRFGASPPWV